MDSKALPLASVAFVLRHQESAGALQDVTATISSFLTGSFPNLPLARACCFGSLPLLDHIWASSCVSSADRTPGWSLTNFLRSDPHYYQWAFAQSMNAAAKEGDLRVVQWLFAHFSGCVADLDTVRIAAGEGHLEILQFLLAQGTAAFCRALYYDLEDPGVAPIPGLLLVRWGNRDMETAAKSGHGEIVRWLFEHTAEANGSRHLRSIVAGALSHGDLPLAEWLLAHGCPDEPRDGVSTGRPDVLEWLMARNRLQGDDTAATAVEYLARGGHLDFMQRLIPVDTSIPRWRNTWRRAVRNVCEHGHLFVVRWLMQNPMGQEPFTPHSEYCLEREWFVQFAADAVHLAVSHGHLELAQYLHSEELAGFSERSMSVAAENGDLRMVQWLHSEFGNAPGVELFRKPSRIRRGNNKSHRGAIDKAARNGHLEVVKFLHSLSVSTPSAISTLNKRPGTEEGAEPDGHRPWATHRAMDSAASNGHLEMVQWLHANRSEGCTTDAMHDAAANGHLEVVQWLYANQPEGCTKREVFSEAATSHWDHLMWLRKKRSPFGANEHIVFRDHRGVAQWLLPRVRAEDLYRSCMISAIWSNFETMLFVHAQIPEVVECEKVNAFCRGPIWEWIEKRKRTRRWQRMHGMIGEKVNSTS
ncbi:hypothetical protein BBJ28_00014959 [Nothophytophthora sp. Chile5]|nr:hypothetical protein BBJ28_00014959 [Nothophytophthora sp. Chile5]